MLLKEKRGGILTKRVIIAGCRNYNNYAEAKKFIDLYLKELKKNCDIIIVSGGCTGADTLGERYAAENNIKVEKHPANWDKYGKRAGPVRNKEMAQISDYLICFWDGKSTGTSSMIRYARIFGLPTRIKYIKNK